MKIMYLFHEDYVFSHEGKAITLLVKQLEQRGTLIYVSTINK